MAVLGLTVVALTPAAAIDAETADRTSTAGGRTVETTLFPVIDTDTVGTSNQARSWADTLTVNNAGGLDAPDSMAAFLQFAVGDAAAVPGTIVEARLVLTATPRSAAGEDVVLTTGMFTNDHWTGQNPRRSDPSFILTGATKPEVTAIEGTEAPLVTERGTTTYQADVTAAVAAERDGDGAVSLRVWNETAGGRAAEFHSDSGTHGDLRPRLVVTSRTDPGTARDHAEAASDLAAVSRAVARYADRAVDDLPMPDRGRRGSSISWWSWDEQHLRDDGTVTRPVDSLPDATVYVDVTAANGEVRLEDRLRVVIPHETRSAEAPEVDAAVRPVEIEDEVLGLIDSEWDGEFTHVSYPRQVLDREIGVATGESIQAAVDEVGAAGGGVVRLGEGLHELEAPLDLHDRVTLVGAGQDRTVVRYSGSGEAIGTTDRQITDVVIKGLTLEGARGDLDAPSGVYFAGADPVSARHQRIVLQDLTVRNFGGHGIHIKRASDIVTDNLTSMYNGERHSLFHNVYWLFDNNILQSDVDLSKPVNGKGAKYTSTADVIVQRAEIRHTTRNAVQADGRDDERIFFHRFDISGAGATALWMICEIFHDPGRYTEDPTYSPNQVIINRSNIVDNTRGGVWKIVTDVRVLNSRFDNIDSDLMLLNTHPTYRDSTFAHEPEHYTDRYDVPDL
ncbi:immunoglobulin-like domain-containing protein [Streptomyces millisiae]|uniref:Right handed beta helix domain-containing protein n=1 Tax=Streptomyces millisiae TaxID=3075542 RepID=A0ABU2LHG9_9ACTN|nr:immunoglobulin-like domain-containing protein [Streptomyces sp. DSM 44918]MDT0317031.1 hypothetical protein [Streptomyces sp. DSM 44918]